MSLQVLSMLNFIFLTSSSGGPDLGDPSYSWWALQALWNLVFGGPRIIDYSLMLQAAQTESLPILQRILVVQ